MSMTIFNARDLLYMDSEAVSKLLPFGWIGLNMDDGCHVVTSRDTILSHFCWGIHRDFPKTPLTIKHHVNERILTAGFHTDLMSEAFRDCYFTYGDEEFTDDDSDNVALIGYVSYNKLYNFLVKNLGRYISSISILDFIEVMEHPIIKEANRKILEKDGEVTELDLEINHRQISGVVNNPNELKYNGVAIATRASIVRPNQVMQCVGPRGYVADANNIIIRKAIRNSFTGGQSELIDALAESRSSTIAQIYQTDPMRKSEHSNRGLQLTTSVIRRIVRGDCGSRRYSPIHVSSRELLRDLEGIYYLDPETGKEDWVNPRRPNAENYYLGKLLMIRSVLTCLEGNRHNICARCFGLLAVNIPKKKTNIGHYSCTTMEAQIVQDVLSTKHFNKSAISEGIKLSEYDRKYVRMGLTDNCLYLARGFSSKTYQLIIPIADAPTLHYINDVEDTSRLYPSRVSEIDYLTFLIQSGDDVEPAMVKVSSQSVKGSLSAHFLAYAKQKGIRINEDNAYVIDMSDWDKLHPLIELPYRHFSTVDYMLSVDRFLKGTADKKRNKLHRSVIDYHEPMAALIALHELVSMRLAVSFSHLQVIILSTLAQNAPAGDYRIPMPRDSGSPALFNKCIKERSMGAAMAYDRHYDLITAVSSYTRGDRPPSEMDWFVM